MRGAIVFAAMAFGMLVAADIGHAQSADEKPYNPMVLLKNMSADLGELKAFSFETTGFFDERVDDQLVKRMMTWSVSVSRPNKLAARTVSDAGDVYLLDFDGAKARVFYVDSKEYAEIPFEGDISGFVDFADDSGLTRTPLNDFLRKDLYGDIEKSIFDATLIAGYNDPEETDDLIHHVLYQSANTVWQVWIREDEERYTPHRSVVTYVNRLGRPEFANQFRNWSFSVDIEAAATAYGIPKSLDGWKKVEFVNPIKLN